MIYRSLKRWFSICNKLPEDIIDWKYPMNSREISLNPIQSYNINIYKSYDWLVLYLPLWKILVSWDDDIPNIWKVIKFHGSSHHQPDHHHIPIVVGILPY